jgi:TRAP-type transport system periplasmic protein
MSRNEPTTTPGRSAAGNSRPLAHGARRWSTRSRLAALVFVSALLLTACGNATDSGAENTADGASPGGGEPQDGASAPDIEERLIRVQSTSPVGDPWQDALEVFKEEVEERSGGRITVDTYCCGELASNTVEEIQAIAEGDLDGAFIAGQALTVYDDRPGIFNLPFLASDPDSFNRILDGPGKAVWEDTLPGMGLHPIVDATSNQGFRQLTNNVRPVRSPEDLNGLRIRIPDNPMWHDVMTTLGADFVSMPFGDVPGALQQGVVDGQENPLNLIDAAGLDDFQDYLTVWNYAANPIVFALTLDLWESMEPEAQQIIEESAVAAAMWHRETYPEIDERLVTEFEGSFESLDVLTAEEQEAFRDAVTPVYDEWAEVYGPELVDEFERVAAEG